MATMKVSNEQVIISAKQKIETIQKERHLIEEEALKDVLYDFNNHYSTSWIYSRKFLEWFKFYGPFALIGLLFYPWSVFDRWLIVKEKPVTNNPVEMAEWIYDIEDSYWRDGYALESEQRHREMALATNLICMAKNNEEDCLTITREEAIQLGIC